MSLLVSEIVQLLNQRRLELQIPLSEIGRRAGLSIATVKKVLAWNVNVSRPSFEAIVAISFAMGVDFRVKARSVSAIRREQARRKAKEIVKMIQASSALEAQAVDEKTIKMMEQQAIAELLSGPRRMLWSK